MVAASLGPHNIKLQHIEAKGVVIIRRHPVYDRTETDLKHARERETGSHIATILLTLSLTVPYCVVCTYNIVDDI